MFLNIQGNTTSRATATWIKQAACHTHVLFTEGLDVFQGRTWEDMPVETRVSCGNCWFIQVPQAATSCHQADAALLTQSFWHIVTLHCPTLRPPLAFVFLELEGFGQSQVQLEQIPAFPSIIKQRRQEKSGGWGSVWLAEYSSGFCCFFFPKVLGSRLRTT